MLRRDFIWLGSASALAVHLAPVTGHAQQGRADLTAGGIALAQTPPVPPLLSSPPDVVAP